MTNVCDFPILSNRLYTHKFVVRMTWSSTFGTQEYYNTEAYDRIIPKH